jgi:hypothetical protein
MRARDNPFRTGRLGALPFRHGALGAQALHGRWQELGARAAIVGPHGSGKTTLLRELAERFAAEGRRVRTWFLNAASPRPSARALVHEARALTPGDVLVFDGASHLPRSTWWRVRRASRAAGGVLVTSHVEGLLPTLVETRTDAALLAALARELLGPRAGRLRPFLEALHRQHTGNLHDVFLALYDLAARDDPRVACPHPAAS